MSESVHDALVATADAHALALTPAIEALMSGHHRLGLDGLRRLRAATRTLHRAVQAEAGAEIEARRTEGRARRAQAQLVEDARPRLEEVERARLRHQIAVRIQQWSDPYASDVSGTALLDEMHAMLRGTVLEGAPVHHSILRMRTEGPVYDAAVARRQAAIETRVMARHAWNAEVHELVRTVSPTALASWWAHYGSPPVDAFPEEQWFALGEE